MNDNPYDSPFGGSAEQRALYEYNIGLDCILPILERWGIDVEGLRVLDLGCGSGGLATALAKSGAVCSGIDLKADRIAEAIKMAASFDVSATFQVGNILEMNDFEQVFDLVVLSETVEHLEEIPRVKEILSWCQDRLNPGGRMYVSFPPWFSPFAGHQAGWPTIHRIPWFHLLPDRVKYLLAREHTSEYLRFMEELNHLTLAAFEQTVTDLSLDIEQRELYLLRPEFYHRYGVRAIRSGLLGRIPILCELTTMGAYYLLHTPS